MTDLDLDDIQARADAATEGPWTAHTAGERGGDHWYICDEGESIAHVSGLHDALDRVASYGLNLTEVFRPHTAEHEVGGEIIRRIKMNPPPVGGKP